MPGRTELFVGVMSLFVASLLCLATYFLAHGGRASRESWAALLMRLKNLDRETIATIALDQDFMLNPSRISQMIGGMKGLEALESNCAVLVDLAFYVQRSYPEALAVAEELRLNAREIQWHLGRLRGAASVERLSRLTFQITPEELCQSITQ